MAEHATTVHHLRSRWKPHKERLQKKREGHPTTIRFHRACSWLQRAEQIPPDQDPDIRLTCQWIAFNALYGEWDPRLREPQPDREGWRGFLSRILALDADNLLSSLLEEQREAVMAILDDAYLGDYFWREPSIRRAKQTTRDRHEAATWYIDKQWVLILEHLVDRIYFMRCQLSHGAATYGGKLNRESLKRCTVMLDRLLATVMLVFIDHGADENWGILCYPPQG